MPRPGRIHIEGGVYHVYNRLGRGEQVFGEDEAAATFVSLLRDVVKRDGLTVFAWCLMSNHYHLAVRTGAVSLDRPIRSLQQRFTRYVNLRDRVYGPLWQGRYKAKLVADQRYLDQLLVYIHLNPVTAGLVDDPAGHRWSGHRELLKAARDPITDADEVLRLFGTSRRSSRAAYVRHLNSGIEEEWIGEIPGRLPWWRLGRPPKSEEEDPEISIRQKAAREEAGPDWRPAVDVDTFLVCGAAHLGVDLGELGSRFRGPRVVRARELLITLGAERYGLKVKDLALGLGRTASGGTQALARGIRRRCEDEVFRSDLGALDRALAETLEEGGK